MNEMGVKTGVRNECRAQVIEHLKEKGVEPLYIVISGSHLYGFPSADSDIDIRCCHVMDTKKMFHIHPGSDQYNWESEIDGTLIEFESVEVGKVVKQAMKNNSNFLEHIHAKNLLPVESTEMLRLRELTKEGMSQVVYNPYHGMGMFNYKKFIESMNPTYSDKLVKKYLYVLRAYLVGAFALRTGQIKPNIKWHMDYVDGTLGEDIGNCIRELIQKKAEAEYRITAIDHKKCREAVAKCKADMELAKLHSTLPEKPDNFEDWDDYMYNVRLRHI